MARTTHPDENLLAAFAERTLSSSERLGVLEHLSSCSDCRDMVFLAQQAASDAELQTMPLESKHRTQRWGARRWHWGAVASGALLSALLIVAPVLIYHGARRSTETPPKQLAVARRENAPAPGVAPSSTPSEEISADSLSAQKPKVHARVEPRRDSQPPATAPTISSQSSAESFLSAASTAPRPSASPVAGSGAEIVGSVVDASGAAIAGAKVSALRIPDKSAHEAVTDQSGRFAVHGVARGNYKVNFTAPGFESATKDVSVPARDQADFSTTLKVGSASQSVEVSGGAVGGIAPATTTTVNVNAGTALPQTQNGPLSGTISSQQINSLPVNGRNFMPSAPLAAGASALVFSVKDGVLQGCVNDICAPRAVPSPSPVVSVASDSQTAIAVDAEGSLFVSTDHGEHWVKASSQWQGKAVAVQVDSPLSAGTFRSLNQKGTANSTSSVGGPVPAQAPMAAPSIFELRNERGQVWLSSDEGKTWRLK